MKQRFQSIQEAAAKREHGTRAKYVGDRCRCLLCRAANSRYSCERQKAHDSGDTRGIVPAKGAVDHIRKLREKGVGYRTVAEAAGVSRTVVAQCLNGTRRNIRANTSRAIQAVMVEDIADGALVPARATWRLIDELVERGYSKAQLAKWFGYTSPAIQLNKKFITASNAFRIQGICDLIKAGRFMRDR